jgi:DNA-binding MarR family transcriptional regulator
MSVTLTNNSEYVLNESLGYLSNLVSKAIGSRLTQYFREDNIPFSTYEWFIIIHLAEHEGTNQQRLGQICGRDRASITRIIDQLEGHDIVRRESDVRDRRNKRVFLTDYGRRLQRQMAACANRALDDAIAGISKAHQTIAIQVMQDVLRNLSDEVPEHVKPSATRDLAV